MSNTPELQVTSDRIPVVVRDLYIDCRRQGMNVEYDEFLMVLNAMLRAGYEIIDEERIMDLEMALSQRAED